MRQWRAARGRGNQGDLSIPLSCTYPGHRRVHVRATTMGLMAPRKVARYLLRNFAGTRLYRGRGSSSRNESATTCRPVILQDAPPPFRSCPMPRRDSSGMGSGLEVPETDHVCGTRHDFHRTDPSPADSQATTLAVFIGPAAGLSRARRKVTEVESN